MSTSTPPNVQLGLLQNWRQFTLLVIVNAFVGGMIGLERTILPELAQAEFGIAAKTAISDHHPDAAEGVRAFNEKRNANFNDWLNK